jgi:heptose-I-phosphate ethanolaminephosphotransferase
MANMLKSVSMCYDFRLCSKYQKYQMKIKKYAADINLTALGTAYLFFFYFSGITHLLLQLTNTTIFFGLRQAAYMSLLWLIPILMFPNRTKIISGLIGLILWITSLISIGYFCIYQQEFSQSVLFIIFESNPAESQEFIAQYFKWWMAPVFLSHTLIAYLLWRCVKPINGAKSLRVALSLIIFTLAIGLPTFKDYILKDRPLDFTLEKLQKRMEPAQPWQLVIGYMQYQKQLTNMHALLEKNNSLPPLSGLKQKDGDLPSTLLLVIGESTNRNHMSLYGYNRETSPNLKKIEGELAVFKKVVSPRPYTIEALEQVLTFADQENPDLVMTKPSLMNMMKQAGYKTYWITNQQTLTKRNTMLTTFSKQMDIQKYMNNSRAQNSREYDENVFEPLEEALKDNAKHKFIVIHLLGTHMKYDYRYPPEFEKFKDAKDLPSHFTEIQISAINNYDNAVLYNDFVVSKLITTIKDKNERILMVYFSDHGEDVYDTPPHNMLGRNEGKPTAAMYTVPFIVWQSEKWQESRRLDLSKFLNRPYSTSHFIHTWADLVGFEFSEFDSSKSLINEAFKEKPLLVGDPKVKGQLKALEQ